MYRRDDHVVFRNLIQASGIIEKKNFIINIHMPTINYPPKLKKIIAKVFDTRNEHNQKIPDGSDSNFKFFLAEKEGIDIAISNL